MSLRLNILGLKACKRGEKVHYAIDYQLPHLYATLETVICGKFKQRTRPDQMWAKLWSRWVPVALVRLFLLQSTLALRMPCYCGCPDSADSSQIIGKNRLQTFD